MIVQFEFAHKILLKLFCIFLISLNTLFSQQVFAAANVLVTPTRVVFEDRMRSAQVSLMNSGDQTGTFRISFLRQKMTDEGNFVPVAENEEGMFSDTIVRFSPRQIRLEPGQSQVIRLMLRKPRRLAEGEYRSHLLFQALPEPSTAPLTAPPAGAISIEILPMIGVSIPVIVRHGDLESSISLTNVKLFKPDEENSSYRLAVDMNREGPSSVYGDFHVHFTPQGGSVQVIGRINGVAVYTPNSTRHLVVHLTTPSDLTLGNGSIDIHFTRSGEDPDVGLLAEAALAL